MIISYTVTLDVERTDNLAREFIAAWLSKLLTNAHLGEIRADIRLSAHGETVALYEGKDA